MRIQRVVLEDHRDVAILRLQIVDDLAVDLDGTVADLFKTRYHAKRGGFAAAGRADKHDELFVLDIEVEVVYGNNIVIVNLFYVCKFNTCHIGILLFFSLEFGLNP